MKEDKFVIGILGGMGTYATIHVFERYADIFKAEKEWERPRIIIDNRCTMPSRVRAYIYHEKAEELVLEMTDSIQSLMNAGCNKIILACNTSHVFLPEIYGLLPSAKSVILNIIDICVAELVSKQVKSVYLLASEGTIDSAIYQKALEEKGIECNVPKKDEYEFLRKCIEAVKQKKYTEEVKKIFLELISRHDSCILGCTELPILYDKYQNEIECKNLYDPIELALTYLKKEYNNE